VRVDELIKPVDPDPVRVWGLPFAAWTLPETVDQVDRLIRTGRPSYFMTVNVHTAMLAWQCATLRAVIDGAAFALADGMPIVWASRLQGRRLPERVAGSDLMPVLCERAARERYRLFFLGGPPGAGQAAAEKLTARYPGLQVVGVESPPYRPLTADEDRQLLGRIREARPHLLLVAFGQPKGEHWVAANSPLLEGTVCVQVGASLDFAAGRIRRAPRWVQKSGLEWVYRLSREPVRLFGRYSRNLAFVGRMLASDLATRLRSRVVRSRT
jgi:N-acetylglucosaminyldiphosphoundecaprenol N-acetyl-beta-D-mannosaminyltransferase